MRYEPDPRVEIHTSYKGFFFTDRTIGSGLSKGSTVTKYDGVSLL